MRYKSTIRLNMHITTRDCTPLVLESLQQLMDLVDGEVVPGHSRNMSFICRVISNL
jgi:hypothetical protein